MWQSQARVLTHFTLNGHIPVMSGHVLSFVRLVSTWHHRVVVTPLSIVRCSPTCVRASTDSADQPPVLLLNAHPVSGHSPALLTSHTGDFNDSHCSVLCSEQGPDWLTLTPCSALVGATRPTLLTIAGRPVLTCERPHWLGARGSSHLQNLARAFLRCWGL